MMNEKDLRVLEFPKIRELMAALATTELGRARARARAAHSCVSLSQNSRKCKQKSPNLDIKTAGWYNNQVRQKYFKRNEKH